MGIILGYMEDCKHCQPLNFIITALCWPPWETQCCDCPAIVGHATKWRWQMYSFETYPNQNTKMSCWWCVCGAFFDLGASWKGQGLYVEILGDHHWSKINIRQLDSKHQHTQSCNLKSSKRFMKWSKSVWITTNLCLISAWLERHNPIGNPRKVRFESLESWDFVRKLLNVLLKDL